MRAWLFILSGLLIWAAHFFALYVVASLFPGMRLGNILALALTLLAFAAAAWMLRQALQIIRSDEDDSIRGWMASVSASGNAVALVAIAYQAAPALLLWP